MVVTDLPFKLSKKAQWFQPQLATLLNFNWSFLWISIPIYTCIDITREQAICIFFCRKYTQFNVVILLKRMDSFEDVDICFDENPCKPFLLNIWNEIQHLKNPPKNNFHRLMNTNLESPYQYFESCWLWMLYLFQRVRIVHIKINWCL